MTDTRDDVQDRQQALTSDALYAMLQFRVDDAKRLVNALNPAKYVFDAHPAPTPAPTPDALVYAIDVSSNNGLDISGLIAQHQPDHVITKLYQSVELGGAGARFSIAHTEYARRAGCTAGGYGWLYASIDGAKQVADFLDTASKAGIQFGPRNPLWLDCEDYTDGSYPSVATIQQAVDACDKQGVPCGIYTGRWWWVPRTGNTAAFASRPLWASVYDGQASFVDVDFGGWRQLAGKQWSGSPIDRSVFHAAYATP